MHSRYRLEGRCAEEKRFSRNLIDMTMGLVAGNVERVATWLKNEYSSEFVV